jgi:hypothetical protein
VKKGKQQGTKGPRLPPGATVHSHHGHLDTGREKTVPARLAAFNQRRFSEAKAHVCAKIDHTFTKIFFR